MWQYNYTTELYHHGIKGQKWGVRRFQNPDGTLTSAGRKKYSKYENYNGTLNTRGQKKFAKMTRTNAHEKALDEWTTRNKSIDKAFNDETAERRNRLNKVNNHFNEKRSGIYEKYKKDLDKNERNYNESKQVYNDSSSSKFMKAAAVLVMANSNTKINEIKNKRQLELDANDALHDKAKIKIKTLYEDSYNTSKAKRDSARKDSDRIFNEEAERINKQYAMDKENIAKGTYNPNTGIKRQYTASNGVVVGRAHNRSIDARRKVFSSKPVSQATKIATLGMDKETGRKVRKQIDDEAYALREYYRKGGNKMFKR